MSDCPDCDPVAAQIGEHFDERIPDWQPVSPAATDRLFGWLEEAGLAGSTLLDIGCGGGPLVIRALQAGARRGSGVDLSADSIALAQERAADIGRTADTEFIVGDAATVPLARHDLVVLDKSLCCYPDAARLVEHSAPAAGRIYAFVIPTSRGPWGLANRVWMLWDWAMDTIHGVDMFIRLHDVNAVRAQLIASGFRPFREGRVGLWYVGVFERVP
jgi:SAM-dependent methyltransferase